MYIGSTKSLKKRKYEHFYQLKSGKHHSEHLQRAYTKYGKEKFAFYIIEECTIDNRKQKELSHIIENKSFDRYFGYNIFEPNENNFQCSESTKNKIRFTKELNGNLNQIKVDVYLLDATFIGTFASVQSAARSIKINPILFYEILKGKRKSYKNHVIYKHGTPFSYISSTKTRDMSRFYK